MPAESLSLYRIDDTLAQLFALREELTADGAPPEELAVIDQQLREYQAMVPAKVEGVAAIYRQWRAVRAEVKAERERLVGIEKALEAREERLKAYLAEILEKQPLPAKGCRKLVGASGSQLMLKGNGGVEPLEIDAEKVPDEYRDVVVRMPASKWDDICDMVAAAVGHERYSEFLNREAELLTREPSNKRIREALAQPCLECNGCGKSIGAMIDAEAFPDTVVPACSVCGGSGKQGVPGAHLLARGQHVEIK